MNIRLDVEITPEELRKLLGLPNVEAFNQQLMNDLRQRIKEGAEGYDPIKLFQPYLSGTLASWDLVQKLFVAGAKGSLIKKEERKEEKREEKKDEK